MNLKEKIQKLEKMNKIFLKKLKILILKSCHCPIKIEKEKEKHKYYANSVNRGYKVKTDLKIGPFWYSE